MPEQKNLTPRWVMQCRILWMALRFLWVTLITGICVGTIANINTSVIKADTPLPVFLHQLFFIRFVQAFPIPVYFSFSILVLLTWLSWLGSHRKDAAPASRSFELSRIHMLRRLRLRYEQIRTQSLQGIAQMELGFTTKPTAVHNSVSLCWRLPDEKEQPLPPQISIEGAYELAQRELLILGEPGAGKSSLLLDLALSLVEHAEQNSTQPLPVLLPLSSWATKPQKDLSSWLNEQLALLYDVPHSLSEQWMKTEQVIFLLDGLDEMEMSARPSCIAAINTYHREHVQPLVVCSRTNEYDASSTHERIALHSAIVVQPLSQEKVDSYLESIGNSLAGLKIALRENASLAEIATTPLMLQVLILTYHDVSVPELSQKGTRLQKQIWDDYVQRMVNRKGDVKHYPLSSTITWLSRLAQQMRIRNQTILFPKQLKTDWLPKKIRNFYELSMRLIGLLAGELIWVLIGILANRLGGMQFGIMVTILNIMLLGAILGRISWGMTILTFIVVGDGLSIGLAGTLNIGLVGPFVGAFIITILATRLVGALFNISKIKSYGIMSILMFVTVITGTTVFLSCILLHILRMGLIGVILGMPSIVLIGAASFMLLFTLRPKLGTSGWILTVLIYGLINVASIRLLDTLSGLVVTLPGTLLGILFSILALVFLSILASVLYKLITSCIIWLWLGFTHTFPWKAVSFFEDATARILLRHVGEGYSFAHRLLLDYFADLNGKASQASSTPSSAKSTWEFLSMLFGIFEE